jgi:hypothetical protein
MSIDVKTMPNGYNFKIVLTNPRALSATLLYLKVMWLRFYEEVFSSGAFLLVCSDVIPSHKSDVYAFLDDRIQGANDMLARFLPMTEIYRAGGFTNSQVLHSHEDADVVKAYHVVLSWLKFLEVWKSVEILQSKKKGKPRLRIRYELPEVAALSRRLARKGGLTSEDIYERGRRLPGSGFLHH